MFTSEQIEQIRKYLAEGTSIDAIAHTFDISRNTLEKRLLASGWAFARKPIELVSVATIGATE